MKILISCDMEGISGVVDESQTDYRSQSYAATQSRLMNEINAVIEGFFDGGATEVIVNDSHGTMTNLIPEKLDQRVMFISGFPKKLGMVQGVEFGVKGIALIGYHSMANTFQSPIPHTYAGRISELKINDRKYGEIGLNALLAGHFKTPIILVSGDDKTIQEAQTILGDVKTVITKWGLSAFSAVNFSMQEVKEELRKAAKDAVKNIEKFEPYILPPPYKLEVHFHETGFADIAEFIPGTRRIDPTGISFESNDFYENFKAFISICRISSTVNYV